MAIIQAETQKTVAESAITEVRGQPTNHDIDCLEEELIAVASSIPTSLGGGANGHAGMLLSDVDYTSLAPGTPFINPANPGVYPIGVTNANCSHLEAEHTEQVKQFQNFLGISLEFKDLIQKAIKDDYLLELQREQVAYLNVTPLQMVTHLQNCWGMVNYVDITALMAECSNPWSITEAPTVYFNRVEKAVKQLARAGITWDTRAMLNNALKIFEDAGDYDAAVREWDARPMAAQTWANLKTMMCMEYAKMHCQDGVSARATGHASTHNIMEEYTAATEELIENFTNKHAKQIEALIKSNTETMAKLMKLLKPSPMPAATAGATAGASSQTAQQSEKQQAWIEKCKAATKCLHCEKVHPNRKHEQYWELEA
jgi:hypothetical protein